MSGWCRLLTTDTKRRIDACRDVLVGKLPLPTDQVELITLALIYKFMDDLDEESVRLGGKRSFFTGDLAKYRWRNLLPQTVSAEDRVTLFSEGVEALGNATKAAHLPSLFRDIFRNAFLKFRDGRILTLFLTEVNGFTYSHSEELGNAFEYLLQCMGTQGENGQFRTPRHIIDFMVACLDPQPNDKILDPACGTGGFLVSSYKHIIAQHTTPGSTIQGDKLTHAQRQKVYSNLTGYDTTDLMVKLSKVNLFLHGFPDPAIHIYDTLSNDARWNEKADLVLANPPFMTPKGGVVPHTKFRIAAKKAEVLFTDYIAEHLTTEGRGGVIVPNGIVATTQNAYVKLRRYLVEDSLVAVVSLPAGVFKPYSGVKTSILLLDKHLARQTKEILFLKINADGYDLGDKRNSIDANDLPEAGEIVKAWLRKELGERTSAISFHLTDKTELLATRGVPLNAERYTDGAAASAEVETVRLGDVCEKCQQINPAALGRAAFRYIDIDSVDNEALRITHPKETQVNDAPSRARKLVKRGDVLFSTVRPYLKNIAIVPPELEGEIASTGFGIIRADSARALPEYLFAIVSNQRFVNNANALTNGASYPAITENQLFDLEIPLPPLEEQRKIVAEIEGHQKVIDGARQILTAYTPHIALNPQWGRATVGEVCEHFMNGLNFGKEQMGHGVKFVNIKDLFSEAFIRCDDLGLVDVSPREVEKRLVRPNDLLFVRSSVKRDGVGYTSMMPEYSEPVVFCGFIIKCTPKTDVVAPKYLFYVLRTEEIRRRIINVSSTAAITNISQDKIQDIELPLPPLEEQRRIVAELDTEAAQMDGVRSLIPHFEAKIQRVLDRVWGNSEPE